MKKKNVFDLNMNEDDFYWFTFLVASDVQISVKFGVFLGNYLEYDEIEIFALTVMKGFKCVF